MNELIVWDDEDNKFIYWEDVVFTKDKDDDFIIIMKEIDPIVSEGRNFKSFNCIGKTDINNKKIYADCSIVEFSVCSLEPFSKKKQTKRIGKVRYCNSTCAYEIVVINMSRIEYYDFSGMAFEISDIKIIDTIQENKLGLIK